MLVMLMPKPRERIPLLPMSQFDEGRPLVVGRSWRVAHSHDQSSACDCEKASPQEKPGQRCGSNRKGEECFQLTNLAYGPEKTPHGHRPATAEIDGIPTRFAQLNSKPLNFEVPQKLRAVTANLLAYLRAGWVSRASFAVSTIPSTSVR